MKVNWFNFKNYLMFSVFMWPLVPRGEGMSISIKGILIDASQLISISLVGLWVIKGFLRGISINKDAGMRVDRIAIILFFLATIQLLSVLVAEDKLISLRMWFVNVFTCYFIFFIVLNEIKSLEECNKFINLIIYASLILAATVWYEHLSGVNLFDKIREALGAPPYWKTEEAKATTAARGPLGGKIVMAQYFSLVVFLLMPKILAATNPRNATIWTAGFFFILMSLFFTLTRVSIIAVAIVIVLSILLTVRYFNLRRSTKVILFIIFFGTVTVCLSPKVISVEKATTRFEVIRHLDDPTIGSVEGHIYSLKAIIPAILKLDKFMLGYGPGVIEKSSILGSKMVETAGLDYVHGWTFPLYHLFILESGIFAILFFILIIWFSTFPLYQITRREKYDNKRKMISYGLLLAFASFSIAIVGGHFKDILFLYFALIGLVPIVTRSKVFLLKM